MPDAPAACGWQNGWRPCCRLPVTPAKRLQEEGFIPFNGGFASAAREAFSSFSALIFIGATGIAVRVLAPLVNDKLSDPGGGGD
ncbi:cobalamin biosynthesis protein CbiG [Klebsiella pneumoniae]|uniref:Cobalamin biosynthesis protein CbiG n=1 Tax=Klebsiella pneumoniae TaxID=573 RepID=A0A3S4GDL6_KLEPN|nr:cobalamin biosynthesis protein CbiG [Klebsiella pneumoniae]